MERQDSDGARAGQWGKARAEKLGGHLNFLQPPGRGEIRNSKSEIRRKSESQKPNS
jgi:hypothetical protein